MATGNLGHIAATASLNIDPFQQSTRVLETQIRATDRALKAQEISFKNSGKSINSMKTLYNQTGRSVQNYSALLEKQRQRYEDLEKEIGDVNNASSDQKTQILSAEAAMNKTSAQIEKLQGRYNQLGQEIAIQESTWTKLGNSMDTIGKKATQVGDGLSKFGDKWTIGVTAPIVAGVTGVVKAAMDYETAFAGVQKTVDEVVDSNGNVLISYEDLSQGIRDMSKELPASTTEISAVAEAAGQLGIETESVLSFTRTMIDMGESTNLSAETAAESLARFANITGMSQDQFDQLGSSIVDLGNNFATTEAEIVAMAMRLAGAGSQIGLSEADIMGLSAALSSVGIEAEAGGSAFSKVMVQMQLAAANGGEELEDFANIAGMSASEFKRAFEEDAVGAIGAFVEGLGNAEEKGTTAIQLLDEMGISEVRLRDALLRAGNASELFAGAVETSNDAFEENTALSTEATTRYETLESKLGMLRNQVNDVAIEFGGPLVDALSDGLEAAQPLIERVSDLARSFSEAEPETQQMIIRTIALTAAIGPLSSILGRLITVGGKNTSTLAEGAKWLGKVSGTAKASSAAVSTATTATTAMGTGMAGTAAKTAGLVSTLGTIGPALLIVGGAVAAGTIAWKVWGEDALEASQRTQKWGSDIGEEADKALTEFQNLASEADLATTTMMFNVEEGAQGAIDAYGSMAEGIKESVNTTISETEENLAQLPVTVREIVGESLAEGVEGQRALIGEIDTIQAEISGIYQRAMEQNRELTNEEMQIIENYHGRLAEIRSETLELSADEQRKVQQVMAEDLKSFSKEQLAQRQGMLHEEKELIRQQYEDQAAMLEENLTAGVLSRSEYNEAMKVLNQEEVNDMLVIGAEYMKIWEERGDIPKATQEKVLADMGLTYEQVKQYMALTNNTVSESNRIIAETSAEATSKVREANNTWNSLVLDEKTGEVKTNLIEVIQEATESEAGWEQLEFIMHNAELDTNAMEFIKEALMANGTWWEMDLPPKFAQLQTNSAEEAIKFLKAHGVWDGLPFEMHTAILDSNTAEEVVEIVKDHEKWEKLPWQLRNALVDTNADEQLQIARTAHAEWEGQRYTPKKPYINVESNAATVAGEARRQINSVTGKTVTITTNHVRKDIGAHPIGLAKGTNHHKGGPAWLGDGGNHEPYLTPQGTFGVSPDDWTLYDLPKGTKVWPSIQKLLSDIPKFANGTDIGETRLMQAVSRLRVDRATPTSQVEVRSESSSQALVSQLIANQNQMNSILNQLVSSSGKPVYMMLNDKQIGEIMVPVLDKQDGQRIQDAEGRIFI